MQKQANISKESSERVIDITDFDPTVVEAMLHFMYYFHYTNVSGVSAMVFDAQVYQIADKYGVRALKKHAKNKFGTAIEAGWTMDDFPSQSTWYTPPRRQTIEDFATWRWKRHT
ncbi:hypothetical protein BFJ63_vAg17385 [Fusarium oxysporum f. sp. narcissi]|uniref:BTB domain-containing protein n=1 Tax=Fusarium oxysporum f. sp. narcissi TaxID=451672 RepID=A0A4Q2V4C2_FUSOX|nr:hypothetical protein BFJ63_vAg17385 [Fusarium oxysporum f. sp. narcissi]